MLSQSHLRKILLSTDFSEGSGSTLTDKSGNGNNATIVGGTWTSDRFGRANRAVLLDGVDDYIDLGLTNYQGDFAFLISFKALSSSNRNIMRRYQDASNFLQMQVNNDSTAYRGSFSTSNAGTTTTRYIDSPFDYLDNWSIFGCSVLNGVASAFVANTTKSSFGGGITAMGTTLRTNLMTAPFYIGRSQLYYNMVVDRILFFDEFKYSVDMMKIANRLKIGDIDK